MSEAAVDLADVRGKDVVRDSADVVIVGTGAAGATAARVLTEAGVDVLMVEEGAPTPRDGFRRDGYTAFRRLWRDMAFQVAKGRAFIPILQGRTVGGTTVINGAIIHRIPEDVHAGWVRDGHVDDMLSYAALDAVYDRLDDELGVEPSSEEALGRNNQLMRDGIAAIGAEGNVSRRAVRSCRGSGRCNQGCPTAQKQAMHVTFIPKALADGARLYTSCRVERVRVRGGRAVGIEGRFRAPVGRGSGPRLEVEAKRAVILAASAIQTPLLLAASGVRGSRVGRGLTAHPGTNVMASFDAPVRVWDGATQGYETTHWRDDGMKLETVGVPLEVGAARLPGYGAPLMKRIAKLGHVTSWGLHAKAKGTGSVRRGLFGGTQIRYDLEDEDIRTYQRGIERLVEIAFAVGAREVFPGVHGLPERITSVDEVRPIHDLPPDPRRFHFIAAHLFGTAAMHPDPRRGVVRPDGRTHDVEALYVADSSVFPTNLGVNPQHTICAIAWQMATRLAS